jgi:hypothetical protein
MGTYCPSSSLSSRVFSSLRISGTYIFRCELSVSARPYRSSTGLNLLSWLGAIPVAIDAFITR